MVKIAYPSNPSLPVFIGEKSQLDTVRLLANSGKHVRIALAKIASRL